MADAVSLSGDADRPTRACPRCGGAVEAGCLLGPSFAAFGNPLHANEVGWYDGHAGHGLLSARLPARGCTVTAVRCTDCGLVELYAR